MLSSWYSNIELTFKIESNQLSFSQLLYKTIEITFQINELTINKSFNKLIVDELIR